MTQPTGNEPHPHLRENAAQRMFGAQAPLYAASQVHISDSRLTVLQQLMAEIPTPRWALDLGAGAGFTAFSAAKYASRVLASDITRPMLQETRRIGQERQLTNVLLCQNRAEDLPLAGESMDLVTCRAAGHHFSDLGAAFDEIHRVLRPGGALVMADSVAPEDDDLAGWMNDIELRRDFSHVANRKVTTLLQMLKDRRLPVQVRVNEQTRMTFNDWVRRTATPKDAVVSLRQDFRNASSAARAAFLIQEQGGDFSFAWPSLVFRAIKE